MSKLLKFISILSVALIIIFNNSYIFAAVNMDLGNNTNSTSNTSNSTNTNSSKTNSSKTNSNSNSTNKNTSNSSTLSSTVTTSDFDLELTNILCIACCWSFTYLIRYSYFN